MKSHSSSVFLGNYCPENRAPDSDPDGQYQEPSNPDSAAHAQKFIQDYEAQANAFIYGSPRGASSAKHAPLVDAAMMIQLLGESKPQETGIRVDNWPKRGK